MKAISSIVFGAVLVLLASGSCTRSNNEIRHHKMPESTRFTKVALVEKLDEPMELEVLTNGNVLIIERKGKLKLYDAATAVTSVVGSLAVYAENEDGLLGLAVDPGFDQNGWIYLYYAPLGTESINRLSRFDFVGNTLDQASEKIMLEIPVFRGCCHSGGSLEFGPDGTLYVSLGDDTSPFESDSYNPIDERPGRAEAFDAQRSSGSSNDLRGSILRIKPEPDGTYSIPEGNLFPPGTPNTRPEIYVLGNRNPFRISVDQKTGYLYWGEVGPDAAKDSLGRGPKGYDEINQAKEAGFFGWPYFVGDNKAYWYYDFDRKESSFQYEASKPINNSPNNSGVTELPPAKPAFIWYPYDASVDFPMLGEGGRNAMAGPVFYSDRHEKSAGTFPAYFDGKLFIYDWMRNWIFVVTMDEKGDFLHMEPFMSETVFDKPVDMQFGKDGTLYVLEYGTFWNSQNDDSGLYRITYSEGNRFPVASVTASKTQGAAPLTVAFSSEGSFDHDSGDNLSFSWFFETPDEVQSTLPNPVYTFEEPGLYRVRLTVSDDKGGASDGQITIQVGNEPPEITIDFQTNNTFYWESERLRGFEVHVSDKEDGALHDGIDQSQVLVSSTYLEEGFDVILASEGHQQAFVAPGKQLMEGSDCYACHALNNASVGPSFIDVARKYAGQKVEETLVQTVIQGGGGVWGERVMPAHPQLAPEDVGRMIAYILSLETADGESSGRTLGTEGPLPLTQHSGKSFGRYILTASYEDKGGADVAPILRRTQVQLRHAKMSASSADGFRDAAKANNKGTYLIKFTADGAFIFFNDVDLRGIKFVNFELDPANTSGKLEVRLGSEGGPVIASTPVISKEDKPLDTDKRWMDVRVDLPKRTDQDTLYIVFKGDPKTSIWNGFLLNSIYVGNE